MNEKITAGYLYINGIRICKIKSFEVEIENNCHTKTIESKIIGKNKKIYTVQMYSTFTYSLWDKIRAFITGRRTLS